MLANRSYSQASSISLLFAFSNNTAQPVSEIHFQLAVTKVRRPILDTVPLMVHPIWNINTDTRNHSSQGYELTLQPQTGRNLEPKQSRGVTQTIEVSHAGNKTKRVEGIKLRWRASYKLAGEAKQDVGEIPDFPLA